MLDKKAGDKVAFSITEDPNPLGVAIPEVLEVLMDQEPELRQRFDAFTDGRKRSLIHAVSAIRDIDKQVRKALDLLQQ